MLYKKPVVAKKRAIGVKKITVSLPPEILSDLDAIAGIAGLSRSAFLSSILSQSLPQIRVTVEHLALLATKATVDTVNPSSESLARYNAQSRDAIDSLIKKLVDGGQDDLFSRK